MPLSADPFGVTRRVVWFCCPGAPFERTISDLKSDVLQLRQRTNMQPVHPPNALELPRGNVATSRLDTGPQTVSTYKNVAMLGDDAETLRGYHLSAEQQIF